MLSYGGIGPVFVKFYFIKAKAGPEPEGSGTCHKQQ
jgi:hypothetical protein